MDDLIVERSFDPPLTDEALAEGFERLGPCLEQHGARWVRSYVSADRRRMLCQFQAPDAESLRVAHRTAGVPFVRVWSADLLSPEARPAGG